ncbi:MAG: OB-fold nucleic acid binding domain-containing protein, partial [Bacillota bacterium]|nr:OB-fold nucleic acid binding domain-containing protein [Bacillota bacterium]
KDTYGVILYQEQVMKIASDLAGFTLGQADLLRRSMGKKKAEIIAAQRASFVAGAEANGVKEQIAQQIFDLMEHFAGYGFNKSHSAAYALIAYQTAYLKAHYPVAYLAALLTSVMEHSDKVTFYIRECLEQKIKILPPDVNESYEGFTAVENKIRFGLVAIKNVGKNAITAIIEAREKEGPFKSLEDFCKRVDLRVLNKRMLENLIWCGAFSSIGLNRAQLLSIMDECLEIGQQANEDRISGQISLFDFEVAVEPMNQVFIPNEPEFPKKLLLAREKEIIGFYISGHPLEDYQALIDLIKPNSTANLADKTDRSKVKICGIVSSLRASITRRGEKMAYLVIEDLTGAVNVLVFPKTFQKYAGLLEEDTILLVEGIVSLQEDELKIFAETIKPLAEIEHKTSSQQASALDIAQEAQALYIKVDRTLEEETNKLLSLLMQEGPGKVPVYLVYPGQQRKVVLLNDSFWISLDEKFIQLLKSTVGEENIFIKSQGDNQ